jgi:hypothetical protein
VSILFLAAAIVAFFAEPNNGSIFLFSAQNVFAIVCAALQTLDIIRVNYLLLPLLLIAWVIVAATMHGSVADKSPAACIMLATAVHALFDRLRDRTPVLGRRAGRMVDAAAYLWRMAVNWMETTLNPMGK